MSEESIKVTGNIKLSLIGPDGVVKQYFEKHNLVVNIGKSYLTSFLSATPQTGTFALYAGVGTGTAAPSVSDTDLQTPLPTRVAGTLSSSGNTWNNNIVFNAGVDTGAITEAGLFASSSGANLFARQVFAPFNKGALDTFVINWTVSFS
jgi:hypothetical protein